MQKLFYLYSPVPNDPSVYPYTKHPAIQLRFDRHMGVSLSFTSYKNIEINSKKYSLSRLNSFFT